MRSILRNKKQLLLNLCFVGTLVLFSIINSYSQVMIEGHIIDFTNHSPLPSCSLTLNKKNSINSDENGYFIFRSEEKTIQSLEVSVIGYYSLTIKSNSVKDTIRLDTIALIQNNTPDDYFVTYNNMGKELKTTDKKRHKEQKRESDKNQSMAYVIYHAKRLNPKKGIIRIR